MRRLSILFGLLLGCISMHAQVDTVTVEDTTIADTVILSVKPLGQTPEDTAWKVGGNYSLQFTQAAYSNWQAGGVNSVAGNTVLSVFANYDDGGDWTWWNLLNMAYGLNYQDKVYNKTDDRLELESRVDRAIGPKWSASWLTNFRTQFTNGYAEPGQEGDSLRISTFMAPGYVTTGLGFTYKPNKKFRAFLSPATSKMTFVNDDSLAAQGAYGVDPGEQFRMELGGYVNFLYKSPIMKNVNLQAGLNLYENYLDGLFNYVDVMGELLLFFKVNKAITANISLNAIYDHDIKFDVDEDGVVDGPRTQFKEVLGIGIAYDFGDEYKKK